MNTLFFKGNEVEKVDLKGHALRLHTRKWMEKVEIRLVWTGRITQYNSGVANLGSINKQFPSMHSTICLPKDKLPVVFTE